MSKELQKQGKGGLKNSRIGKLDLLNINTSALSACLNDIAIPRLFYQLVIFILDASESMTQKGISGNSKGEEVRDQIAPIIKRLKNSKNSNSFDISMYAFSQNHTEFIVMETPHLIDSKSIDFNPCSHVGNYQTYAEPVFLEVEEKINNYLFTNKGKNCQTMIVFLGDGDIYDYQKVLSVCERLKKERKTTILSYLLEDITWSKKLSKDNLNILRNNIKSMSSKDANGINFFESKVNPEEIRKHMIKSISTVSKID
jgi:hypothetical protein